MGKERKADWRGFGTSSKLTTTLTLSKRDGSDYWFDLLI